MREERNWNEEFRFDQDYRSYIRDRYALKSRGNAMNSRLFIAGFVMIIVGMMIVSLAAALAAPSGSTSGVIITFPIPVGIAWGPHGTLLTVIGLIIMLVMLIVDWIIIRRHIP